MQGYQTTRTKAQDLTEIKDSQDGFLGGMNLDSPKSDIGPTQLSLLENLIPFRDRLESRGGLRPNTDYVFSNSNINNTNSCVMGPDTITRFYDEEWDIIISNELSPSVISVSGSKSVTICEDLTVTMTDPTYARVGNKILISDDTQNLIMEDRGADYFLRPVVDIFDSGGTPSFITNTNPSEVFYLFKYTFARIINGVITCESDASVASIIGAGDDELDGAINPFALIANNVTLPEDFYTAGEGENNLYTHVRYYRSTRYTLGEVSNAFPMYFVGEYPLDDLPTLPANTFLDLNIIDLEIQDVVGLPADPLNHPIYWHDGYSEILPSRTFSASSAMLLSKHSDSELVYCAIDSGDNQKYFGWTHDLFQFSKGVNGETTVIKDAGTKFIVTTASKTYYIDSVNVAENATQQDVAIFTPILNSAVKISDNIGVNQNQALSFIETKEGRLMALTSDGAVRQFSGYQWSSTDIARNKFHSITKGLIIQNELPCSAAFADDAYSLFYNINAGTLEYTSNVMFTLRMGITEDSGGPCLFTGEPVDKNDMDNSVGWPYLSIANTGSLVHALVIKGVLNVIRKQAATDDSTIAQTPNTLMEYTGDKFDNKLNKDAVDIHDPGLGVNTISSTSYFSILGEVEFPEFTPATESDFLYFLKSSFYLRSDKYSRKYTAETSPAWSNTALSTVSLDDITFGMDVRKGESEDIVSFNDGFDPISAVTLSKEVQDHRIRITMRASNGGYQLTGYEARFKRHMRTELLETTTESIVENLVTDMYAWINERLLNLTVGNTTGATLDAGMSIDGARIGSSSSPQTIGTAAGFTTGPNGTATGIVIAANSTYEYEAPNVTSITNATVMFWGKSFPEGSVIRTGYSPEEADQYDFYVDGSDILNIAITDNEVVTVLNTGYDVSAVTWKHYAFVHDGSNFKLYVDGLLIYTSGANTLLSSIKSASIILGDLDASSTLTIADIRMYNKAITPDELLFYNNNVINNEGDFV